MPIGGSHDFLHHWLCAVSFNIKTLFPCLVFLFYRFSGHLILIMGIPTMVMESLNCDGPMYQAAAPHTWSGIRRLNYFNCRETSWYYWTCVPICDLRPSLTEHFILTVNCYWVIGINQQTICTMLHLRSYVNDQCRVEQLSWFRLFGKFDTEVCYSKV